MDWVNTMKKKLLSILLLIGLACGSFIGCEAGEIESVRDSSFSGGGQSSGGGCAETHTDKNNDGACDVCRQSVTVTFDFFGLNDLHGKFDDTAAQSGVDELSTFVKQTRQNNENTVLLSSGDMWQGSPESNITKGVIMTEWMNEMDFSSMTMGNHEYDWGVEYIQENEDIAEFPFLGINIFNSVTHERVSYCQPSTVVEKSGVQIGIIGAIGDCLSSISGDVGGGMYFKTGQELTALVKDEAIRLRESGVDYIIYSAHADYAEYDASLSDGYVDLVFEGHSHQTYAKQDRYGVYHLQNGGDNSGISHASVTINYANDTSVVHTAKVVYPNEYESLEGDPVVDTLMNKYAEQIAIASRVLGQNGRARNGAEILTTCAQLYYEAGVEKWGTQYDVVVGGGFMSVRAPYTLYAGTVIYGDLMNLLPFDNQLVLCSISGANLKKNFLETTNSRYYVYRGAYYETIKNDIRDTATYYVVTDTYSSTYAPNNLTEIERYDENTFARDLYASYIEEGNLALDLSKVTVTSVEDIFALGATLAPNVTTTESYFVRGEIISFTGDLKYGNMTIRDENGDELYIYGTYDANGNRYGAMSNPPQVGDTVLLEGGIQNYQGTKVEIVDAIIWSVE